MVRSSYQSRFFAIVRPVVKPETDDLLARFEVICGDYFDDIYVLPFGLVDAHIFYRKEDADSFLFYLTKYVKNGDISNVDNIEDFVVKEFVETTVVTISESKG